MSKICPSCGHENRDVAIFCGNCGNKLISSTFTSNFRDTGSSANSSSTKAKPNADSGSDGASVCCAVILILFILLLIMSMG